MNIKHLMKCGCRANSEVIRNYQKLPLCSIHEETETQPTPELVNRKAKCDYCNRLAESSLDLAFFVFKPEGSFDRYYCGCRGWD